MTSRESEILGWIKENPMISQQELAEKAGITRSSVAVHISNLMKKGLIAGKGYVVNEPNYVVVVGGVNVDIGGKSSGKLRYGDSNPGVVTTAIGGVGRNIAHNIALLGIDCKMLSAIGTDANGDRACAVCTAAGIDFDSVLRVSDMPTSTYLYLMNPEGEMVLAVNDMKICERITPQYLEANLPLMNHAKAVVADANIPEESLRYLAENVMAPIFADPVSVPKSEKLKPHLGKLHTLKPNIMEAQALTGVTITGENDLRAAAEILLRTGLKRVFISLGKNGVFAADADEMKIIPPCACNAVNTTGAGDSFVAGLVWAYLQGYALTDSARAACAAAAITSESEKSVSDLLNEASLTEKMNGEK